MSSVLLILIPIGFMLFILRAQLLRIGITELGPDNLHTSKLLGVISGWAEFTRRYGSLIALAVAAIALYTASIVYAHAMRLTL